MAGQRHNGSQSLLPSGLLTEFARQRGKVQTKNKKAGVLSNPLAFLTTPLSSSGYLGFPLLGQLQVWPVSDFVYGRNLDFLFGCSLWLYFRPSFKL
ncbi:MAG: hypothetical protein RMN25_13610 [Anaerolineae bacterium]|nr:hypothetical protein [Thermoflexales bacterium]MDW8408809.1 hypothetical protein [Anaerolineae bacterium]